MKQRNRTVHLDGVLAVLLLGVFAACVLAVLLAGADGYQRLTQRDREAYAQRTAAQYLATRVRQADTAAGMTVEPFGPDGPDALLLYEEIEGTTYVTGCIVTMGICGNCFPLRMRNSCLRMERRCWRCRT